ncbi:LysR substrate-binding domain-containing protein [Bosea sp. RAF48]|uniref:LysR substrate-binding domain-containing protein n=1 Tax=Bosea sp. RAF48 TaxID=3237480 RepID=UPI003F901C52
MLDLNDLYFFAQVVDHKGFTTASRALGVPKSNLSRRILRLEEALGVRLINRGSRHFVVTQIGAEFYQRCRAVVIEAEEAQQVVTRRLAEPAGRVRFSCPTLLAQHVIAGLLPRFMRDHPKVEIVERLVGVDSDLIDEGFDLALRAHGEALPSSELIQRVVCEIQLILVASPAFLTRTGRPREPEDLEGRDGLARNVLFEGQSWRLEHRDGRIATVGYRPVFFSNDWLTLREIAGQDFGVAAIPAYACREAIASGLLERVLPDWRADRATLSILTPSRRGTLPAVRAFLDFLLKNIPAEITV